MVYPAVEDLTEEDKADFYRYYKIPMRADDLYSDLEIWSKMERRGDPEGIFVMALQRAYLEPIVNSLKDFIRELEEYEERRQEMLNIAKTQLAEIDAKIAQQNEEGQIYNEQDRINPTEAGSGH